MNKVLLHMCCAPCSIYPLKILQEETDVTGYFFNPNIHPYTEWKARWETLRQYAEDINLKLILDERYLLEEFIRGALDQKDIRCKFCYELRLRNTAQMAKKRGFDCFSTTLLVSPYQNHQMIKDIGESIADTEGVRFLYRDFRPWFREANKISRDLGMYRQKYCGCIFSEKERYYKSKEKNFE